MIVSIALLNPMVELSFYIYLASNKGLHHLTLREEN